MEFNICEIQNEVAMNSAMDDFLTGVGLGLALAAAFGC